MNIESYNPDELKAARESFTQFRNRTIEERERIMRENRERPICSLIKTFVKGFSFRKPMFGLPHVELGYQLQIAWWIFRVWIVVKGFQMIGAL